MIGIIGFWEYTPKCYGTPFSAMLMNYWKDTIKSFDVDYLFLVDVDLTYPSMGDPDVKNFKLQLDIDTALTEMLEEIPDAKVIFMSEHVEESTTYLKDFVHPEDVIYVIGSDYQNVTQAWIDGRNINSSDYVKITIDLPHKPIWLWSHMVLPLILYDRLTK